MIIAILNQHAHTNRCAIARSLAVLRARSGRKVCMVSAGNDHGTDSWCLERSAAGIVPAVAARSAGRHAEKVESLGRQFNDVVIDTGTCDPDDCYDVLVAAKLALVPIRSSDLDLGKQYALIERIKAARLCNHGLRTLFVAVGGSDQPSANRQAAVHAQMSRLEGAILARAVLRDHTCIDYGPGRCICDAETCDISLAQQMHTLYDEVFALANARPDHNPWLGLPMLPGRAFTAL
ncbi:hypothetical protein [Massilia sp. BJB1822]|uniref:hypothetical protein n=1 Tax=Massilia sp. BJB1822 TaxID=2744470 RepID=UPI0015947703|nr:hypothetical protein [Massilia sp. BJB1822]NVE00676.1 hypothetical protein [Massilia sp. BJB1822]